MEQFFSTSLADPDRSDVLVAAVQWLQGTLLGTVATTVAVIAVASVGRKRRRNPVLLTAAD